MKLIASAFCIAALFSVGMIAQESEVHTKQKAEVKNGRHVDIMGCIAQVPDGFVLRHVNGGDQNYVLLGKTEDVAKHVGEYVEVDGKTPTRRDSKLKVENKSRVNGHEEKSEVRAEGTNGSVDFPLLAVTHIKKIRGNCS